MKLKRLRSAIIIFVIIVAVSLGVLMLIPVSSVSIVGNEYYTQEQLETYVFENSFSRRAFMVLVKSIIGIKKDVPFVSEISIKLTGLASAQLSVTPKDMMGYAESFEGNKYFNSKGEIVERSFEVYPKLPQIIGFDCTQAQVGDEFPASSTSALNELLEVTRFLSVTEVAYQSGESKLIELTDKIKFDESENISCYINDICVSLGVGYNLEDKLIEMAEILPSLEGRSGTLHLEGFDPSDTNHVYLFD